MFQQGLESSREESDEQSDESDEVQEKYAYIIVPVKVSNAQIKNTKPKRPLKTSKYPLDNKNSKHYQGGVI